MKQQQSNINSFIHLLKTGTLMTENITHKRKL